MAASEEAPHRTAADRETFLNIRHLEHGHAPQQFRCAPRERSRQRLLEFSFGTSSKVLEGRFDGSLKIFYKPTWDLHKRLIFYTDCLSA
jgi:hypothetical protein